MATYSGFFNAVDHDRLYNATDFSKFFDGLIADGVYVNFPENATEENRGLHVSPNTGVSSLSVKVAPGRCWFNGYWMYNDAALNITLDNLLTSLVSRIDAIVVDVNGADSARTVDIIVVKGTEATTPDKPSLIHTSTRNQYALAYVTVIPGATSIAAANIEDAILTGETPAVEALLEYSSRSKAEMKTYIDNADTNLQNQVNGIKTPTFTEAAELANLAGSGEGINTMWGKVKKLLSTILSILPVNYGGTGSATHTVNSVLLGNGNSAIKHKASANGAFYSTGNGIEPSFGTLPMAQGGTGVAAATVSELREALGVADASTAASVSYVDGQVSTLQSNFQDGVDTIYNATRNAGVTPSSSTPTDCATAIGNLRKTPYVDTYSFPANDTGGTKTFSLPHTYGKVNAENVYAAAQAVTWTDTIKVEWYNRSGISTTGEQIAQVYLDVRNAKSITYSAGPATIIIHTYNASTPSEATTSIRDITLSPGNPITLNANEKYIAFSAFDGTRSNRFSAECIITRQAKILR